MKEVILVGPVPPPNTGQSLSFEMLVGEVTRRGYSKSVIDISVGSATKGFGRWRWGRALAYVRLILRYVVLLLSRPSVVYLTIAQSRVGFFRDFCFIWIGWLFRTPIVVHLKGGNYDGLYRSVGSVLRRLIRATLRRASSIIVLSEGFRADFDFVGRDRLVRVVANGLTDLRIARVGLERNRSRVSSGPLHVLFLSNFIASKGYRELLQAAKAVVHNGGDIEVRFCGEFMSSQDDPPGFNLEAERRRFQEDIECFPDTKRIKLCGVVAGNEKVESLAWADVFVLPTRYINEGQPVSLIEAMAAGCALVTTRFRAIADMVEDGVNGFFVDGGDSQSISDALMTMMRDRSLVAAMQEASVRHYEAKYTQRVHLVNLLQELERVAR